MTNDYSHREEVEKVLAAVIALAGPGKELCTAAENARDTFRDLGHAEGCAAADELMEYLEAALVVWSCTMNDENRV